MAGSLDEFLELAEEDTDNESFVTCRQNQTINRTVMTINETFYSVNEGDSSIVDEDRSTPVLEPLPESDENRLTLTEFEAREICNLPSRETTTISSQNSTKETFTISSHNSTEDLAKTLQLDSDSDNEDLYEKQSLNKSGKSIKKLLEKAGDRERFAFSLPNEKPKIASSLPDGIKRPILGIKKEDSQPSVSAFDSFFCFKVKAPKVSSLAFENVCDGVQKIKLMQLHTRKELKDAFVTMGVIIEKGEVRKSANGNEYLIWKLHDLRNCQDKPVKLLLFGDACKDYWKTQLGMTVALMSPQIGDQANSTAKDALFTIKVAKKTQIIEIGQCTSYGICRSACQNGQKCTNFVNLDTSDHCVYHIMSEARKLSSKRGTFNNVSTVPPKRSNIATQSALPPGLMMNRPAINRTGTIRPSSGIAPKEGKRTTKEEEKSQLQQIISDRALLPGARNLQAHETNKNKKPDQKEKKACNSSMALFIKEREAETTKETINRAPSLGFGLHGNEVNLGKATRGAKDKEAEAARLRAISILKTKHGLANRGQKRQCSADEIAPTKRSLLGSISNKDDIEKLLNRKSLHDNEAKKEESAAEDRYFHGMEAKEKVESFTTSCMSLQNMKVITCKKCNYTSKSQSEFCMQQGHVIQKHMAEKRFYKCKSCSKRTTCFGLLPTKPCENCESTEWERVAMKDERKVVLENERLELRGEERMNVNV